LQKNTFKNQISPQETSIFKSPKIKADPSGRNTTLRGRYFTFNVHIIFQKLVKTIITDEKSTNTVNEPEVFQKCTVFEKAEATKVGINQLL